MAKLTQTIHRQFVDELFECVWPFCEIGNQTNKQQSNKQLFLTKYLLRFIKILLERVIFQWKKRVHRDMWFACRQMQQSTLATLLWQYGLQKLFKTLIHSLF